MRRFKPHFKRNSKECGGGQQFRTVACVGDQGTMNLSGDRCDAGDRELAKRACNEAACPDYRWKVRLRAGCNACMRVQGGALDGYMCVVTRSRRAEAHGGLVGFAVAAPAKLCN